MRWLKGAEAGEIWGWHKRNGWEWAPGGGKGGGQLAATNYQTELGWCEAATSEHNVWWAQWAEQGDSQVPDTDVFACRALALPKISLTSWPR